MAELTIDAIRTVIREEVRSLEIKFEDLESKVDTALEGISKDLKLKNKVADHEKRVTAVETDNVLLKSTVKLHSRQLKAV